MNLFFEARGESPLGQRWVLDVVRNRVENKYYPDSFCSVIMQPMQFSWYNDHRNFMPDDPLDWEDYIISLYGNNSVELASWASNFDSALFHYMYSLPDISNGSLYYMTIEAFVIKRKLKPFYGTKISNIIGDHIFFKKCNRRDPQCYYL